MSKKDKKNKGKGNGKKRKGSGRVFVHGSIFEPVYRLRMRSRPEQYLRADGGLGAMENAKTFETWREADDYRKMCAVDRAELIVSSEHRTATYCPDCLPPDILKNLGEDWVDTWEIESDGWVSAPVCDACKVAIRVYVNGKEEADEEADACRD